MEGRTYGGKNVWKEGMERRVGPVAFLSITNSILLLASPLLSYLIRLYSYVCLCLGWRGGYGEGRRWGWGIEAMGMGLRMQFSFFSSFCVLMVFSENPGSTRSILVGYCICRSLKPPRRCQWFPKVYICTPLSVRGCVVSCGGDYTQGLAEGLSGGCGDQGENHGIEGTLGLMPRICPSLYCFLLSFWFPGFCQNHENPRW